MEAYAVYYALIKRRDHLEGTNFEVKTNNKNLVYLSQAGSKKVLNWKLEL